MQSRNWCITDLAKDSTLELEINGTKYVVSQFVGTFSKNAIPTAQCQLAVGRDARTLIAAAIHNSVKSLRQMQKAKVTFHPRGEYKPGTPWPGAFVIFEGYFMGFGYSKVNGKIGVIANLKHWAIDLACTSALNQNSHPLNPTHMTSRAVLDTLNGTGAETGAFLSQHTGVNVLLQDVVSNYWQGLKTLFCRIADIPIAIGMSSEEGSCGGTGNAHRNDRATNALSKIEGPADACNKAYKYGVPLPVELFGVQGAEDALAMGITHDMVESYASVTMWDKLLAINSQFSAAFIPCPEYGLVIADLPAYNGGIWQVLTPDDYNSFQFGMDLDRPLRAVGIITAFMSEMGIPEADNAPPASSPTPWVGGCWTENGSPAQDEAAANRTTDGVIWYQQAPRWLQVLQSAFVYDPTGGRKDEAPPTDTTPDATGGTPSDPTTGKIVAGGLQDLLDSYARSVFVAEMLRGRQAVVGGKLRFDIAPGSIIKLKGSEERFLGGEDVLATDMIGCVVSTTILINAEAAQAGTTFVLSDVRSIDENNDATGRTSVDRHPIFNRAIHGNGRHGSPLVPGHEKLELLSPSGIPDTTTDGGGGGNLI